MKTFILGHEVTYNSQEELSRKINEIRSKKVPKHLRRIEAPDSLVKELEVVDPEKTQEELELEEKAKLDQLAKDAILAEEAEAERLRLEALAKLHQDEEEAYLEDAERNAAKQKLLDEAAAEADRLAKEKLALEGNDANKTAEQSNSTEQKVTPTETPAAPVAPKSKKK